MEISTETGFNVEEMFQIIAQLMWKYCITHKLGKILEQIRKITSLDEVELESRLLLSSWAV